MQELNKPLVPKNRFKPLHAVSGSLRPSGRKSPEGALPWRTTPLVFKTLEYLS